MEKKFQKKNMKKKRYYKQKSYTLFEVLNDASREVLITIKHQLDVKKS